MESLNLLPSLTAAIVPALLSLIVAFVRKHVGPIIPNSAMPFAMMVSGAVLSLGARLVGIELDPLTAATPDAAWLTTALGGVMTGAVSVGYHQLASKVSKALGSE